MSTDQIKAEIARVIELTENEIKLEWKQHETDDQPPKPIEGCPSCDRKQEPDDFVLVVCSGQKLRRCVLCCAPIVASFASTFRTNSLTECVPLLENDAAERARREAERAAAGGIQKMSKSSQRSNMGVLGAVARRAS